MCTEILAVLCRNNLLVHITKGHETSNAPAPPQTGVIVQKNSRFKSSVPKKITFHACQPCSSIFLNSHGRKVATNTSHVSARPPKMRQTPQLGRWLGLRCPTMVRGFYNCRMCTSKCAGKFWHVQKQSVSSHHEKLATIRVRGRRMVTVDR